MIEKDDWRLLNDVERLKNIAINPTDGEDITHYANHLKKCFFLLGKSAGHCSSMLVYTRGFKLLYL